MKVKNLNIFSEMTKISLALSLVFTGFTSQAGEIPKGKTPGEPTIGIDCVNTLKNTPFTLKSAAKYKGSINLLSVPKDNKNMLNTSLITYQKGNTVYIVPHNYTTVLPKFKTPSAPKF